MTLLAAIVENVYEIRALVGCVYVTGGIAGGVYGGRTVIGGDQTGHVLWRITEGKELSL